MLICECPRTSVEWRWKSDFHSLCCFIKVSTGQVMLHEIDKILLSKWATTFVQIMDLSATSPYIGSKHPSTFHQGDDGDWSKIVCRQVTWNTTLDRCERPDSIKIRHYCHLLPISSWSIFSTLLWMRQMQQGCKIPSPLVPLTVWCFSDYHVVWLASLPILLGAYLHVQTSIWSWTFTGCFV